MDIDLDHVKLDIECPGCRFRNNIRFRDVRLRDVVICRGCKSNLRLDDNMNECRKARKDVRAAMSELTKSLTSLNTTITFKI
jgi:hypothetical protein